MLPIIFLTINLIAPIQDDIVTTHLKCKAQCDKVLQSTMDQCVRMKQEARYACIDAANAANCDCQEQCIKPGS
jgi:hypothetical protein